MTADVCCRVPPRALGVTPGVCWPPRLSPVLSPCSFGTAALGVGAGGVLLLQMRKLRHTEENSFLLSHLAPGRAGVWTQAGHLQGAQHPAPSGH